MNLNLCDKLLTKIFEKQRLLKKKNPYFSDVFFYHRPISKLFAKRSLNSLNFENFGKEHLSEI